MYHNVAAAAISKAFAPGDISIVSVGYDRTDQTQPGTGQAKIEARHGPSTPGDVSIDSVGHDRVNCVKARGHHSHGAESRAASETLAAHFASPIKSNHKPLDRLKTERQ